MKSFAPRLVAAVLTGVSFASLAHAAVTLPNGAPAPANPAAAMFLNGSPGNDGIDENLNVITAAEAGDVAFEPLCGFQARFVAKGGGASYGVGYYSADPARPANDPPLYVPVDTGANLNVPAAGSEMNLMFRFASSLPPAGQRTFADLPAIRALANSGISIALIPNPNGTGNANATQYAYAESRHNVFCALCSAPGYWPRALVWRSTLTANRFYIGFEDLDMINGAGNVGVNGNDLDYEDFLFRFDNALPRGSGFPCSVPGAYGICARGTTTADFAGVTTCSSSITPQTAACNGLDNDCDGVVDEGPCDPGESCVHGACKPSCDPAECNPGETCDASGACVESTCADVVCGPGERCAGGDCIDACTGIVCPQGLACESGACIDACALIDCGADQVCERGVCVNPCDCFPGRCGATGFRVCDPTTRLCVTPGCESLECGDGGVCQPQGDGGVACADPCNGVVCPFGEVCSAGACVERPFIDAGPDGGSTSSSSGASGSSSGGSSSGASGTSGSSGAASSSSGSGSGGVASSSGGLGGSSGEGGEATPSFDTVGGGGCSTGGGESPWSLGGQCLGLVGALVFAMRRQRR